MLAVGIIWGDGLCLTAVILCELHPLCPILSPPALLCKQGPRLHQSVQVFSCQKLFIHHIITRIWLYLFGLSFQCIICDSLTASLRYKNKTKACFLIPQKLYSECPMQVNHHKLPHSENFIALVRCLWMTTLHVSDVVLHCILFL